MRLKSISLHGFKSFQGRTEIPLAGGITGIVGPNGCGKSNVSDAIRWVLGEGNVRNLRGENILDVIFKGAGSAKPAGFAEVSLLIDNEDHALSLDQTEVAVARRVHRTGDSDFLINNRSCRLKDIRNLFLGTGLGSQGYSIIERGMVDAVLSDRDDQRRLLFEEAAGISRYKLQRREATRKLEATEQDLVRIDDIVREIEREVRSLARQVGKARKYHRLHDQIRTLEVDLALRQWNDLDTRRAACASEQDLEASDRERISGELTRKEAEQETRKLHLMERERLLEESRKQREAAQKERSDARDEIGVLSTRIQGWESREEGLTRRITEETERGHELRQKAESSKPEAESLSEELAEQQETVRGAEGTFQETERQLKDARVEAARTAQVQMEHLVVRTKESQELESLSQQVERLEKRGFEQQEHHDRLRAKTGELEVGIAQMEEEIATHDDRLEQLGREREDMETARELATKERDRLRENLESRGRQKASLESRLHLLQEQTARHEGFDAGVRYLLDQAERIPGIVGVVGDLIEPAPDLPPATVEALIADAVQWVVVRDEQTAFDAIDALRQAGHGGVTLFPLAENSDRDSGTDDGWGSPPPISGPSDAASLIRFLLTRVRRVESREQARATSRWDNPALRCLTPEGEVYAAEGWIRTAGSRGGEGEILERMQEIPRLEGAIRQTETEERELAGQVRDYEREIEELTQTARQRREEQEELAERHRRLDKQLSERRVEVALLVEETQRVSLQLGENRGELERCRESRGMLQSRLQETGLTEREADRQHREAKAAEETAAELRDKALEELSARRTESIRIENAYRKIEESIRRDLDEANRLEEAIAQWTVEREETIQLRNEAQARRTELEGREIELNGELVRIEAELDKRRRERDEEQTLLAAHEQDLKVLRSELSGLQERLHDGQVRELTIRSEMERIRERIRQEFRIDLVEVAKERTEAGSEESPEVEAPLDEELCKLEIADLRGKLLKIGPVNFLAAEEYDRQKERLLFHRTERDDLRKARQDLLDAIREINETAGRMFVETFSLARVHFQETFQKLFPGGEADLMLVGDDPLEGSIEVKARPRGKKLEAIRLLSTGERSLTAIALLFGIYLVKPSPFCILDELDAPLDDVNIGRFVAMLRYFSEKTQFVVITHNKRTMEAADRLYGVTMQSEGISKIVSVRLSDADLELTPEAAEILSVSEGERENA